MSASRSPAGSSPRSALQQPDLFHRQQRCRHDFQFNDPQRGQHPRNLRLSSVKNVINCRRSLFMLGVLRSRKAKSQPRMLSELQRQLHKSIRGSTVTHSLSRLMIYLISAYSSRADRNVRAFWFFRDCSCCFFEPQPVNSENSVFRWIRFDQGVIFAVQTSYQV
jgi:hypothetical protein